MAIYLSASSIKDFIKCSQMVLYRVTKPFPVEKSKDMLLGEVMHSVIERGWRDRDTALTILEEQRNLHKLNKTDMGTLSFYTDIFFLNFRHLLYEEDSVEYQFKIPLHDNVYLVGKMDRISRGNVFDWKTGSKLPKTINNDVQCMIYDFAYREIFKKEPSSVCLAGLADGRLVPFSRNEFMYKELFTKVIPRMIKTMKNDAYERVGMFNHSCYRCQYKSGCLGNMEVSE